MPPYASSVGRPVRTPGPGYSARATSLLRKVFLMHHWKLLAMAAALPLFACSSDSPADASTATALVSVSPSGGAASVSRNGAVTITFDHAIMAGMERYALLHEGGLTGSPVAGSWILSADRKVLAFTPASALKAATQYTIHLGGGMMDGEGHPVNMDGGMGMGGQYASGTMMSGGMMGSGGMMSSGSMMGTGWQAASGTFGMLFTFTTA